MSVPVKARLAAARAHQSWAPDGVLVVTLDVPGEKVNTLGRAVMEEAATRSWRRSRRDPDVRAIVLRSGKPDNFIAGADIKDFIDHPQRARRRDAVAARARPSSTGWRRCASRWWRRSTAPCIGGGLETVRWPAATASRPTIPRPCSACPR